MLGDSAISRKTITHKDLNNKSTFQSYLQNTIFTIISIGARLAVKPIQLRSYFRRMKKIDQKYTLTQMAIKDIIVTGLKNDIKNYAILLPAKDYIKNHWTNLLHYEKQGNVAAVIAINFTAPAIVNALRGLLFYNSELHKIQFKIRKILKQRKLNATSILAQTLKFRNIGIYASVLGFSISAAVNIGIFDTMHQLYLNPIQNSILVSIMIGTLTGYVGRYVNSIFQLISYEKVRSKQLTLNNQILYKTSTYPQIWQQQSQQILSKSSIPFIWSLRNGIILTTYQYLKQNYTNHINQP